MNFFLAQSYITMLNNTLSAKGSGRESSIIQIYFGATFVYEQHMSTAVMCCNLHRDVILHSYRFNNIFRKVWGQRFISFLYCKHALNWSKKTVKRFIKDFCFKRCYLKNFLFIKDSWKSRLSRLSTINIKQHNLYSIKSAYQ